MSFVTTVVLILFGLYIANSLYVIYHLFHVPGCEGNARKCIRPHAIIDKKLEVSFIYDLQTFVLETLRITKHIAHCQKYVIFGCVPGCRDDNFDLGQATCTCKISDPGPGVICGLSLLVLSSAPRGFSPGTPVFPSPQKPQKPTFDLI